MGAAAARAATASSGGPCGSPVRGSYRPVKVQACPQRGLRNSICSIRHLWGPWVTRRWGRALDEVRTKTAVVRKKNWEPLHFDPRIRREVLRRSDLSPQAKIILAVAEAIGQRTCRFWASQGDLVFWTGLQAGMVYRSLHLLEVIGAMECLERGGGAGASIYRLAWLEESRRRHQSEDALIRAIGRDPGDSRKAVVYPLCGGGGLGGPNAPAPPARARGSASKGAGDPLAGAGDPLAGAGVTISGDKLTKRGEEETAPPPSCARAASTATEGARAPDLALTASQAGLEAVLKHIAPGGASEKLRGSVMNALAAAAGVSAQEVADALPRVGAGAPWARVAGRC